MPLTRRGWAVLVLSVGSYVAGVWAGYPLFRGLAGVALGTLVVALAMTVRKPRLDIRRDVYPDRVERGKPALATLRVRNAGNRWQGPFVAYDVVGTSRSAEVAVRRLAPGAEAVSHYELPTVRRGRLTVGPLVLERADPLGLARRRLSAGGTTVLWVHPRRHPVRPTIAGRPRHHHEGRTTDDSLRGSADLRDVRPYVVGDEVRHLHWKATARVGQLMVRDYIDPDQPRLSVLLDTRPVALSPSAFEEAVEVAASVVFAAAMAGQRCRLLTPSGWDLAPTPGPTAARVLLDALTEMAQTPDNARLLPPVLTSSRAGGGSVVLVTGPVVTGWDLATLATRYRSVTAVSIGPISTAPQVQSPMVRRIVAGDAADAVRQWNLLAPGATTGVRVGVES